MHLCAIPVIGPFFHFRTYTTIPATSVFRVCGHNDIKYGKCGKMLRVIKKEKEVQNWTKRGLCVLTVFHFHGTKASSGNTVLQLALVVIVPAEKPLSFLRGCIQIYSLTAVTDHSRDTVLWQ